MKKLFFIASFFMLLGMTACSSKDRDVLARKSCSFEVAGERGAFLTEHRRCLDPIIAYCNDYVYHGRLLPKKGNKVKYKDLPPKGYVHVNGVSEKGATGSVLNRAEAAAIEIGRAHV